MMNAQNVIRDYRRLVMFGKECFLVGRNGQSDTITEDEAESLLSEILPERPKGQRICLTWANRNQ